MAEPARDLCPTCRGAGLLVEAAREGYHIYRQCQECKGTGFMKGIIS